MPPDLVKGGAGEVGARLLGMDASLVEDLGAIDVTDAREHRLVHEREADRLARSRELFPEPVGVGVLAKRVLPKLGALGLEQADVAELHRHGGEQGADAVLPGLEPQAGRRAGLRTRQGVMRGEPPGHPEVHVHDVRVRAVRLVEEVEEVLADRVDTFQLLAVDHLGAVREAAVGRGGGEALTDEVPPRGRGDAMHAVTLDHGASDLGAADCDVANLRCFDSCASTWSLVCFSASDPGTRPRVQTGACLFDSLEKSPAAF